MPENNSLILTKIVATIGPACSKVKTLSRMIEEGVRVVRINFSHGDFEQFKSSLDAVRQASKSADIPVGVLGDLRGPKLRVGKIKNSSFNLEIGDSVQIVASDIEGHKDSENQCAIISTSYPKIVDDVKPGDRVLINDGAIRMLVTDNKAHSAGNSLVCTVTCGGIISNNKGINLPDTKISAKSLTEYDMRCIKWAAENELDFLALSFVRSAEDVTQLKQILKKLAPKNSEPIPVISKIETPQAVGDIEDISKQSDGLMVARGDLGVELDVAKVPIVQKNIIKTAHSQGKPVIVATQMLQSMIEHPQPTRAEISDVANAILDKTDAVMLSGETAIGKYPLQTVATMAHTASVTENYAIYNQYREKKATDSTRSENLYRTAALAHGLSAASIDLGCKCVVIWSQRGGGARYISQNRLPIPIVATSSDETELRRMSLFFGVRPVLMELPENEDDFIQKVNQLLKKRRWANRGDSILIMSGEPLGTHGVTNKISMHYVDDVCELRD